MRVPCQLRLHCFTRCFKAFAFFPCTVVLALYCTVHFWPAYLKLHATIEDVVNNAGPTTLSDRISLCFDSSRNVLFFSLRKKVGDSLSSVILEGQAHPKPLRLLSFLFSLEGITTLPIVFFIWLLCRRRFRLWPILFVVLVCAGVIHSHWPEPDCSPGLHYRASAIV